MGQAFEALCGVVWVVFEVVEGAMDLLERERRRGRVSRYWAEGDGRRERRRRGR